MADATYNPLVYRKQGGDELVVANGGTITIESGGTLSIEDGANALVEANIDFGDGELLRFGDSDDVTMQWDATNFLIAAAADDSLIEIGDSAATQKSFDVKVYGNASNGADYMLWDASASNLGFVGGVSLSLGVSGTPVTIDTADTKFLQIYVDCGASSGDARGIYDRLYITGTGSGEALRAMTTVSAANAATGGTINGAHISLDIDASASISGQAFAARFTYGANNDTKTLNTNNSVIFLESDLGTGITAGALNAFIRIGDNTAQRIANLLRTPNASNGTLLAAHTTDAMSHSLRFVQDDGTVTYLMCTTTATNRS
jgi:hypothetical protein